MYHNKVDISGVDTSQLKILKEAEKIELLRASRTGDKKARDMLIKGNLRLVLSVIQKFMGRGENPDDLFQVGCIGLIKAIDNFDIDLGVQFSTYAVPMIIGEVRRFLRDSGPMRVSRGLRDLAYRAMQAREQLMAKFQREPDIMEIAEAVGVPKAEVVTALESISDPVSLYEPVYSDSGDTLYILDQVGDGNDSDGWIDELAFKDAMHSLNEREKRILYLRFLMGHTQMEVAAEIGISQAQVSRLEKSTLDKIKGN